MGSDLPKADDTTSAMKLKSNMARMLGHDKSREGQPKNRAGKPGNFNGNRQEIDKSKSTQKLTNNSLYADLKMNPSPAVKYNRNAGNKHDGMT